MIDQTHMSSTFPAAPARTRLQPGSGLAPTACRVSVSSGEVCLVSGVPAINGFTIVGHKAHAAVRMHVTPATYGTWSTARKAMTTTSSAGRLRTG